jgi:hypothetical protein
MKLYHGTTEAIARKALKEGLKPRIATGKSNWKHTSESNPSLVYLTDTYAPYFAIAATRADSDEKIAIIEVDTAQLDDTWMRPDEDAIEQGTEKGHLGIKGTTQKQRTKWIRNHIDYFKSCWTDSLKLIGNCAYKGVIPPSAITRVVLNDRTNRMMEWAAMDPTITTINYRFYGAKYRLLLKWYLGETVTTEEWFAAQHSAHEFLTGEERKKSIEATRKTLADQSSVQEIYRCGQQENSSFKPEMVVRFHPSPLTGVSSNG